VEDDQQRNRRAASSDRFVRLGVIAMAIIFIAFVATFFL
jgi:hypothetical protein